MKHEVFTSCCHLLSHLWRAHGCSAALDTPLQELAPTHANGSWQLCVKMERSQPPCGPPSLRAVTSSKDLKISTCISSENISTKNAMYAVLHPQTAACVRQLSPWQSTRPCKRAHGCSSSVVMSARVYPQVFVLLTDSSSPRKPSFSSITALVVHLQCTPLHAVHT